MDVFTAMSAMTTAATLLPLATQLGQVTLDKCVATYMNTSSTAGHAGPGGAPPAPDVRTALEELDVHAALATAHALIQLVAPRAHDEDEEWEDVDPKRGDVLAVCVKHLHESMQLLRHDIQVYEQCVDSHAKKWFASRRTLHTGALLDQVYKHKRLFDVRLRMLLDIVAAVPRVQPVTNLNVE
jgi:hypothetical protein